MIHHFPTILCNTPMLESQRRSTDAKLMTSCHRLSNVSRETLVPMHASPHDSVRGRINMKRQMLQLERGASRSRRSFYFKQLHVLLFCKFQMATTTKKQRELSPISSKQLVFQIAASISLTYYFILVVFTKFFIFYICHNLKMANLG